jgi:hypothetical protein
MVTGAGFQTNRGQLFAGLSIRIGCNPALSFASKIDCTEAGTSALRCYIGLIILKKTSQYYFINQDMDIDIYYLYFCFFLLVIT